MIFLKKLWSFEKIFARDGKELTIVSSAVFVDIAPTLDNFLRF